jgi:N-acetylglutamate synthase-like GNAT family acetyltransferase
MIEAARAASPHDAPAIAALLRELTDELVPMRGGAVWSAQRGRTLSADDVEPLLADPRARVVVGTINDAVVGVGIMEIEALADGTDLAVVRELVVTNAARLVGVGERIAGALVDLAREAGCAGIDAFALPGHRAAKNFFEENGFTARLIVMHKRLS